ncbi:hypothetical protein D3C73_1458750 [compost metagenome]
MLPEPPIRAKPANRYQSISGGAIPDTQIMIPMAIVMIAAGAVNRPSISKAPQTNSAPTIPNWNTFARAVKPPSLV